MSLEAISSLFFLHLKICLASRSGNMLWLLLNGHVTWRSFNLKEDIVFVLDMLSVLLWGPYSVVVEGLMTWRTQIANYVSFPRSHFDWKYVLIGVMTWPIKANLMWKGSHEFVIYLTDLANSITRTHNIGRITSKYEFHI